MNLITALVLKEESLNLHMRKFYEEQIDALPRGTIIKKRVGANEYYISNIVKVIRHSPPT
jgi:hypothetical protein